MARIDDIPQPTRDAVVGLEIPVPGAAPFQSGLPLSRRRLAIVSSAALVERSEPPFMPGSAEYRALPATLPPSVIRMSHVSINFDRTGFQRDINVVYPVDRLRELTADGTIGSVADTHYSVMGSTDPATMDETVDALVGRFREDRVDAVLFLPV
ncbi:MAG: glycine/sarcosine/betaine reductase selenoprotein B family protein [Hyphomicrobiaceae bacterium]